MVTAATSFGRSGITDFLVQRFSGLILAAYIIFVVGFLVANPGVSYEEWRDLYAMTAVRIFSFITLLSVVAHGWIGLWVILTDYITDRMVGPKAMPIRLLILSIYALVNAVIGSTCAKVRDNSKIPGRRAFNVSAPR